MKYKNGFSLIELLLVVTIIGILAAIAVPAYTTYVLQANRTAAINGIMDLASREARYYTTNNTYTSSMVTLGYTADPMPLTNGSSTTYYNLSVSSASATAFSLQAVRVGNQLNDTCGTYTLNQLGVKGISSGSLGDCWKQ